MGEPYMPTTPKSTDYETPHDLFDALWEEFGGFDLDPCGQREHHSVSRIFEAGGLFYDNRNEHMNGLTNPWKGKVYMNPPYGREAGKWVAKAVSEIRIGNAELVVALLKVTTDRKWWHEYVEGRVIPRFIKGRLTFAGEPHPAPFASVIIVWRA